MGASLPVGIERKMQKLGIVMARTLLARKNLKRMKVLKKIARMVLMQRT